jgi:hypothetical protein
MFLNNKYSAVATGSKYSGVKFSLLETQNTEISIYIKSTHAAYESAVISEEFNLLKPSGNFTYHQV